MKFYCKTVNSCGINYYSEIPCHVPRQTKYYTVHVHLTTGHTATSADSIARPFVICTVYLLVDYTENITVEMIRNEHNRGHKPLR